VRHLTAGLIQYVITIVVSGPELEILMSHLLIVWALLSVVVPVSSTAQAQDFGIWRALTAEEEKTRIGDTPISEADPSMIEADFDGDGRKDKALLAVRKTDDVLGLIVLLKARSQVFVLSEYNRSGLDVARSGLPDAGLRIAEPGAWEPNCYDKECFKDRPKKRILKNPGILYYAGPNTVLYFWESKTRSFGGSLMVH
jgi:hypothetical protein